MQTPDGALYLVEGGRLNPIEPVQVTLAQIAGLPVGPPVTTGVAAAPVGPEAGPPPPAFAPLAEGRLVQTPDGALYVVEGGQLNPIEPVQVAFSQVDGIPIEPPVTTGLTIMRPAAPVPPEPSPPSAPPSGATAGPYVGEAPGLVRLTILEVRRPYAHHTSPPPRVEWALIRVRVENLSRANLQVPSWYATARDRMVVHMESGATVSFGTATVSGLPEQLEGARLSPGASLEGNTAFAVPVGQNITRVTWPIGGQTVEVPLQ